MLVWLILGVLGCKEAEPWCVEVEGATVNVCTVDEADGPLTVREVVWFRDIDHPDYDGEHDADCANDDCSLWTVEEALSGELSVAARYYGPPHYTPGCAYLDTATTVLTLETDSFGDPIPALVTLVLDTNAAECND